MRFLSTRRENEIVAYIEQARIEHIMEIDVRDEMIISLLAEKAELETSQAELQSALKIAAQQQRELLEAFIEYRDEGELAFDLDHALEALNDQIAQLGEHFA